jgi:hypothetical protein
VGICHLELGSTGLALEGYRRACAIVEELRQPMSRDMKDMQVLREGLLERGIPEDEVPWPDFWESP